MTKSFIDRTFAADVAALFEQRRLAWQLFLAEMAEHRRTSGLGLLAPFVSVLAHVAILGTVMALVFGERIESFIPFFAISFSIWQAVSIAVTQSANANERASRYLHFPNLSGYLVHLVSTYELATALLLKVIASLAVIAVVDPVALLQANYAGLLVGLVLVATVLLAWALPIAFLFDRVRLLRGFLSQMLLAVYLLTPILWDPSRLAGYRWLVDCNPVFHVIEVARAPLLDGTVPLLSALVVGLLTAAGIGLSALLYPVNRRQMIFRWMA
jgi:ABC-type polysaccharide/polyol phosphate export permease